MDTEISNRAPTTLQPDPDLIDLSPAHDRAEMQIALDTFPAPLFSGDQAKQLKVLLVEDNEADARLVREMLNDVWDFRYEIINCNRAGDVFDLLKSNPDIDCVLLDLTLPDAQGLYGLIDVRYTSPNLPIVVLTGLDNTELALQALQEGAQDYLVKGRVDGDVLSRSIRYAIERKRSELELAHEALHDPLTGLSNRRLFLDRVTLALARLERSSDYIGLLFVDLDRFKAVNDALGHEAGDKLLITVARRLEVAVRPSDTVGRFGGDEFTVLCEGISGEREARAIADRVAAILTRPATVDGKEIEITASIGIVVTSAARGTPQRLIADADTAMYEAKARGKARGVLFDRNLGDRISERVEMEGDLEHGLTKNHFKLYYQPQVALESGSLVGVEALLRWDDPSRGVVQPDSFIEIAEESGLIVRLGSLALHKAAQQASEWATNRLFASTAVSVNISPRQLADPNLESRVRAAVSESGIDPGRVCLEITEKAVFTDLVAATRVLNNLKGLGVKLAVDDFGTGYSSLVYVKRLPVDILKIDRSFVAGIARNPEDAAIVSAVIDLAHALGLATVAEGIERPEQLTALRTMGCDVVQGNLFACALPPEELLDLLTIEDKFGVWAEGVPAG